MTVRRDIELLLFGSNHCRAVPRRHIHGRITAAAVRGCGAPPLEGATPYGVGVRPTGEILALDLKLLPVELTHNL